eukprot:maker-scaffold339_size202159-snap-gene-1.21 protein:Tk01775 transcript:maker-scaffold339_size202159-snap-gene-1.21-mRNA-1 annotation:"tumor necrosis factor alpha-induced protein 8-like protein"
MSEKKEMTADFKALDIGYEVQRSFANKFFSNKNVAKGLIDDTSAALLDELYKLVKIYTQSKKDAEKIVKNIIKISVKVGMLERSDKFSSTEKQALFNIQRNLRTVAMTLISFFQVDHTYDRNFLIKYVSDLQGDLKSLVKPHLTEKSLGRIDQVLDFFSNAQFLDSLYVPDKNQEAAKQMGILMLLLNRCMEEGVL